MVAVINEIKRVEMDLDKLQSTTKEWESKIQQKSAELEVIFVLIFKKLKVYSRSCVNGPLIEVDKAAVKIDFLLMRRTCLYKSFNKY